MASPTEENYLKALFVLANERGEVNLSELSKLLGVSPPSVNSMVKNLKKQGLLNYEKYRPLSLTEAGKKEAAFVLRKHRLTEMYLVEKMGFGWEVVHEIAEQVEHIDSTVFFDRMDELMGFPKVDPHGAPIPDKNGILIQGSYVKLSSCSTGEVVRLAALVHASTDFLKLLDSRQLVLGTELEIKSIEPYDDSMVVSYQNHPLQTFSSIVCDRLLVERLR